ncbi:Tenascin-like protein [Spironucleus salmonicida]|uniref:Tenascin n=1 Tax=Spironucleus salmonicida TaxID=348837 RepID=V6LQ38_9EUKA|nr:Tenascin-like protein [Spironucleus salmonicida]|eukprot:EST46690.1 Tenascin [Spironucleus salmonicida]
MPCNDDKDCGQGTCVENVCQCNQGYTGDACKTCDQGYTQTRQGCLKECSSRDCPRAFVCADGIVPGKKVCTCATENFDPSLSCLHCKDGFNMSDGLCLPQSCFAGDIICSEHGICDFGCECFNNYTGQQCDTCDQGSIKAPDGSCLRECITVKGELKCMLPGLKCNSKLVSGKNVCVCQDKFADPDHNCFSCVSGYSKTKQGCIIDSCVFQNKVCNNEGDCFGSSCECNDGYQGNKCEVCQNTSEVMTTDGKCIPAACIDRATGHECSANGTCNISLKKCSCKTGYTGLQCNSCTEDFRLIDQRCQPNSCFVFEYDQHACSNNGICNEQGDCVCNGMSGGIHCESCRHGFDKVDGGDCIAEVCVVNNKQCNGFGHCISINDDSRCLCKNGYDGQSRCVDCEKGYQNITDECVSINCIGRSSPLPCSGNGSCQVLDIVSEIYGCACKPGFIGRFCDDCNTDLGFVVTNNHTCVNQVCVGRDQYECSGNGECINAEGNLFQCRCTSGATGKFCQDCNEGFFKVREGKCVFESCISDAKECSGNGHCRQLGLNHRCICDDQFDSLTNCQSCVEGYSLKDGRCLEGSVNKLSGGAIAGIVIGILILISLIALIIFFIMRRKPNNTVQKTSAVTKDLASGQKFI